MIVGDLVKYSLEGQLGSYPPIEDLGVIVKADLKLVCVKWNRFPMIVWEPRKGLQVVT